MESDPQEWKRRHVEEQRAAECGDCLVLMRPGEQRLHEALPNPPSRDRPTIGPTGTPPAPQRQGEGEKGNGRRESESALRSEGRLRVRGEETAGERACRWTLRADERIR